MFKQFTNKQAAAIHKKLNHDWQGLTEFNGWLRDNTITERDPAVDWRDEKPKYTIKLFGNGRWQMEG